MDVMLFAVMLLIGIFFQVISIYWESYIFCILTAIWFMKLIADAFNLQYLIVYQPVEVGGVLENGSYEFIGFQDYGLQAILFVFVFINIVLAIYYKSQSSLRGRMRVNE